VAVQVVAEQRHRTGAKVGRVAAQPAFGRPQFAVLFLDAVLRPHELRLQGDHPPLTRRDQQRCDEGVRVVGAVTTDAHGALRTVDLLRTEVSGAIQRQQPAAKVVLVVRQIVAIPQVLKDAPEGTRQVLRGNRVEQIANVRIAGHLLNAEQTLGVVVAVRPLHVPLVGQERGRLHEKDGKGPQGRIGEFVNRVRPRPVIR